MGENRPAPKGCCQKSRHAALLLAYVFQYITLVASCLAEFLAATQRPDSR